MNLHHWKAHPLMEPENQFPPAQLLTLCSSSTHISGIVLEVTAYCTGEFPLEKQQGYSVSWEMGIGGVLGCGCLVRVCPSQDIGLRLLGLFLLLGLIISDALAIVLPSQVSNQILWMVCILLYKIWRDIISKEIFPFCFWNWALFC